MIKASKMNRSLWKILLLLLTTATLVASQCTVGSILPPGRQPLMSESRQYINLAEPAPCRGSITAWHFCYFNTQGEDTFEVEFRVWRPKGGGGNSNIRSLQQIHNDERTITSRPSSAGQTSLSCMNITLRPEEYVNIRANDAIGIYVTSVSVVGKFETAVEGAGIHEDRRSGLSSLLSSSIEIGELMPLNNTLGLFLYADISTASPPPTVSPMVTTATPPSVSPNVNVERQGGNNIDTNGQGDGGDGGNKTAVIAIVVIVVLLLIGAGVVLTIVVLVVYMCKRNKSINCFKRRENGLFQSIDNLIYRAGSDRIPFSTNTKQDSPYDIPRDRHDRTLYDIPKSLPPSINDTTNVEVTSQIDTVVPAPSSHYLQTNSPKGTEPHIDGGTYDIPRDHSGKPEKSLQVTSIFDDPEYIYMSNASGSTDRDEEMGGNDDKTTSDVNKDDIDSNSEAYISISFDSVEYRKMLKKATDGKESEEESHYSAPPSKEDEIYIVLSEQRIKVIPRNTITKTGHLGSGEYATVNKGVWKNSKGTRNVAVKTLLENATENEKICLLQEAVIMGQFVHPNIVQLFGVVTHGDPVMLVLEHMPNGDLKKYLNQIRPEPGQLVSNKTPKLLLGFSQQVALGMHYLASKGFVHRDLAARNIFVSEDITCKIGDFGRSRDMTDGYYKGHGGKVPLKWTAPEAIRLKKYSTASDVWSYGCLLYEIWSLGRKPFKGMSNTEAINKVSNGYRLPPPPGCPKSIYELMMQCWHPAPAARPKYREILTVLLGEEHNVLNIPAEDASTSSQACLLGAPIENGEKMYRELQTKYLVDSDNKHNPDYEYVKKYNDSDYEDQ